MEAINGEASVVGNEKKKPAFNLPHHMQMVNWIRKDHKMKTPALKI